MSVQWPWVLFTLFAGLGAGLLASVALAEWSGRGARLRLPAAGMALVALLAGGAAYVIYLGHPERVFNVLGNLGSSMAQSVLLTGLSTILALAYVVVLARGDAAASHRPVATLSLVSTLLLAAVLGGNPLAAIGPAWSAWLTLFFYLVSAAVLGLFALALIALATREDPAVWARLNRATLIALLVQATIVIVYGVFLVTTGDLRRSSALIAQGNLLPAFWGWVVAVGLGIPLALNALWLKTRQGVSLLLAEAVVGCLAVAIGGGVARALLFVLTSNVFQF